MTKEKTAINSGIIITLGALCGWFFGRLLTNFLHWIPGELIRLMLGLCLPPLCVLVGALVAVFAFMEPVPPQQDEVPLTSEPPQQRHLVALFGRLCGMTWPQRIPHAIGWALVMLLTFLSCAVVSQDVLGFFGIHAPSQPLAELVMQIAHNPAKILVFSIASCILTPIAEEMLYRHLIPEMLAHLWLPNLLAVIISALLFAAAHGLLYPFLGFFFFALIQSHIDRKTDLIQCMLAHGLYNVWTLALLLISTLCHANVP